MANINENEKSSQSQNARIAKYMQEGNSITALEALDMFGCFRLASRITDLKQKFGLAIVTDHVVTSTGKRVAQYRLATT